MLGSKACSLEKPCSTVMTWKVRPMTTSSTMRTWPNCRTLSAGPYASIAPHRVEAPFQLVLGDAVVRGRIDAVYARPDGGFDVVDYKTGKSSADPLQLAIYRAAWAQIAGVPVDGVGAAFYYVSSGEVVRYDDLPDAEALAALLTASN